MGYSASDQLRSSPRGGQNHSVSAGTDMNGTGSLRLSQRTLSTELDDESNSMQQPAEPMDVLLPRGSTSEALTSVDTKSPSESQGPAVTSASTASSSIMAATGKPASAGDQAGPNAPKHRILSNLISSFDNSPASTASTNAQSQVGSQPQQPPATTASVAMRSSSAASSKRRKNLLELNQLMETDAENPVPLGSSSSAGGTDPHGTSGPSATPIRTVGQRFSELAASANALLTPTHPVSHGVHVSGKAAQTTAQDGAHEASPPVSVRRRPRLRELSSPLSSTKPSSSGTTDLNQISSSMPGSLSSAFASAAGASTPVHHPSAVGGGNHHSSPGPASNSNDQLGSESKPPVARPVLRHSALVGTGSAHISTNNAAAGASTATGTASMGLSKLANTTSATSGLTSSSTSSTSSTSSSVASVGRGRLPVSVSTRRPASAALLENVAEIDIDLTDPPAKDVMGTHQENAPEAKKSTWHSAAMSAGAEPSPVPAAVAPPAPSAAGAVAMSQQHVPSSAAASSATTPPVSGPASASASAVAASRHPLMTPIPDAQQTGPSNAASRSHHDENTVIVNNKVYYKLQLIGSGGSSQVYRVLSEDKQILALKQINLKPHEGGHVANYMGEISLLERFRNAAHVIQLIDYEIVDDTTIYMIFEAGTADLAHIFKRTQAQVRAAIEKARKRAMEEGKPVPEVPNIGYGLNENQIRFYWQEMLQCVRVCHKHSVIHLDLKPSNFVFVDGGLKIIDFGIATNVNKECTSVIRDTQVGTINYMSPESIQASHNIGGQEGYTLRKSSDIWSLGCILYQMIYGQTPFAHLQMVQKLHAITDERYVINFPRFPPHLAAPGSPSHTIMLDVLKRCLDRDPKTRITLDELLNHHFLRPSLFIMPSAPTIDCITAQDMLNCLRSVVHKHTVTEKNTSPLAQVLAGLSETDKEHLANELLVALTMAKGKR